MEKTLKYYNNRPVLVLKKDDNSDFYQVLVNLQIKDVYLDYIAESFRGCDACMVGHKSTCYCDDEVDRAYGVLERIMEENIIDEENLFYVRGKELKDHPFEWRENEKLKNQISANKNILNGIIDIVAENKSLIKQQEKQLKDNTSEIYQSDKIIENRKHLIERYDEDYKTAKERVKQEELKLKNISVDSKSEISREEYIRLSKRDELLQALENGGVDNWEWYGEATKNIEN